MQLRWLTIFPLLLPPWPPYLLLCSCWKVQPAVLHIFSPFPQNGYAGHSPPWMPAPASHHNWFLLIFSQKEQFVDLRYTHRLHPYKSRTHLRPEPLRLQLPWYLNRPVPLSHNPHICSLPGIQWRSRSSGIPVRGGFSQILPSWILHFHRWMCCASLPGMHSAILPGFPAYEMPSPSVTQKSVPLLSTTYPSLSWMDSD